MFLKYVQFTVWVFFEHVVWVLIPPTLSLSIYICTHHNIIQSYEIHVIKNTININKNKINTINSFYLYLHPS